MRKKISAMFFTACLLFGGMSVGSLHASAVKPDVAVTIDQVSVSLHELEQSGYEVPVLVHLEQNVNLNAAEFGLSIDRNCRFEILTRNVYAQLYNQMLDLEMSSSPDIDGCTWITWARKEPYFQENSNILVVLVKIPETAQPGDVYDLHYLTQSPLNAEKNHIWYNYGTKADYTTDGTVIWNDGSVTITEDPEQLPGDINLDGSLDIRDVVLMNRVYVGCESVTSLQIRTGDLDGNGRIDLSDSMKALRKLVGLE
ncbi:MAG: dockerin type I repeat-containing protein [Oscillospiraceae bacterium]|nr:dockerin type I repeat-containing protein [Oscillospiraceae bacterium]MDE5884305.1 dockerin type I repeat-containing protein [Oscillospiraceae bacterium]